MANSSKIRFYNVTEQIDHGEKVKFIIDANNIEAAKTIIEEKAKKDANGCHITSRWWKVYNKYEGGWKWFYCGGYMNNHKCHTIYYELLCMR